MPGNAPPSCSIVSTFLGSDSSTSVSAPPPIVLTNLFFLSSQIFPRRGSVCAGSISILSTFAAPPRNYTPCQGTYSAERQTSCRAWAVFLSISWNHSGLLWLPDRKVGCHSDRSRGFVSYRFFFYWWDSFRFFSPPSGAFVIAPSVLQKLQSIPFISSYCSSVCCHIFLNTPFSPIPEISDGPNLKNRCLSCWGRSTGNLSSGRRGWHPWHFDRKLSIDGVRADVSSVCTVGMNEAISSHSTSGMR